MICRMWWVICFSMLSRVAAICRVLQSNKESTRFQVYFVFCSTYMSISARVCPAYLGFLIVSTCMCRVGLLTISYMHSFPKCCVLGFSYVSFANGWFCGQWSSMNVLGSKAEANIQECMFPSPNPLSSPFSHPSSLSFSLPPSPRSGTLGGDSIEIWVFQQGVYESPGSNLIIHRV